MSKSHQRMAVACQEVVKCPQNVPHPEQTTLNDFSGIRLASTP
jgi:hypothetical protein